MIVMVGRPVRDRAPAATEWRLIEYDATTRLPVGDLGCRWEPADPAGRPGAVTDRVTAWAGQVLGQPITLGRSADELAGPGSWHLHPRPPDDGSR